MAKKNAPQVGDRVRFEIPNANYRYAGNVGDVVDALVERVWPDGRLRLKIDMDFQGNRLFQGAYWCDTAVLDLETETYYEPSGFDALADRRGPSDFILPAT